MAATNKATTKSHVYDTEHRLAGGYGAIAAKQDPEQQLRRMVLACLLWEDLAYVNGKSVADEIKALVPQVDPARVAALALEARYQQKLRHIPLLLVREMVRHESHRPFVRDTLRKVIHRPDELSEFLALYWKEGRCPLACSVKRGLADAFSKFDAYQLAKWDRASEIRLRDVLFLCHAAPETYQTDQLWKQLIQGTLPVPETWEVGLSAAKSDIDKRIVWCDLIARNKLGALAVLRNLRNMEQVGVPRGTIANAIAHANPAMLLPINFLQARDAAPDYTLQIEDLMFRCAAEWPKLPGWTVFVVDVSGSMLTALSKKSNATRLSVAAAMSVLASEMCDNIVVYATAGCDSKRTHATCKIKPQRGFALSDAILHTYERLGGGGIFTRQCLEYISTQECERPDRIIVFSDSQDCDWPQKRTPKPFGKHNYIVDVSAEKHGVAYKHVWDAEVSGWSEYFLRFIAAHEQLLPPSTSDKERSLQ